MDLEAALLGIEFNPSKVEGATTPTTRLEALGLLIEAPLLQMDLPAHKKKVYRSEALMAIQSREGDGTITRRELECLAGKLIWASKSLLGGTCTSYTCLMPLTQSQPTMPPQNHMPPTDKALAMDWHESVGMHESMLARKDVHVDSKAFKVHMYADASKVFGAGVTLGHDTYSHSWPEKHASRAHRYF